MDTEQFETNLHHIRDSKTSPIYVYHLRDFEGYLIISVCESNALSVHLTVPDHVYIQGSLVISTHCVLEAETPLFTYISYKMT